MAFKSDAQRKAVMAILKKQFGGKIPKGHMVLFHVSPKGRAKRILKEGLVPRTKSSWTDLRRKYSFLTPDPGAILYQKSKPFFPRSVKPQVLAVAVKPKDIASSSRRHFITHVNANLGIPASSKIKFPIPGEFSRALRVRPYREFVTPKKISPEFIRKAELNRKEVRALTKWAKRRRNRIKTVSVERQ